MSIKKLISCLFLVFVIALASCTDDKKEEKKDTTFTISDTMMKRIQIETVKKSVVVNEIRLAGKVVADEQNVMKISPLAGGTAVQVNVELGDYVEKGKVLAVIKSSEVADFERQ